MRNTRPILGLTMGDPAGIGPELCLRTLRAAEVLKICTPVLFGDAEVLKRVSRSANLAALKCRTVSLAEFAVFPSIQEPLIVACNGIDAGKIRKGTVSAACGRAAYNYIEESVKAALAGKIAGVVTAPIHKESLHLSGIKYPGHTEIFTALTKAKRSCMMLHSDLLTVSMVTTHIGFVDVPRKITTTRILDVIELTATAMKRIRQRAPKLAVCGLNPHAGESGLFGRREEERFVGPAIAKARKMRIQIDGPLAPDAAFTAGQRKKYDAIVCLYHDQGHIPFKMLAFDTGVNVTLGLPIIRTSVDHGTAFDIAWRGKADPTSLYSAVRVAANMTEANL